MANHKTANKKRLLVRQARLPDVPQLVELTDRIYGKDWGYSPEMLRAQQTHFPEGQFVAEFDGRIVGFCATFRIDEDTALVVLSHVTFKSGYLHDARAVTARAREVGAWVLWDLSHSVGVVPIELDAWGAALAVGCSYKYLNGGPGAPAFLYVRRELQERLRSPVEGWFGRARPFGFDLDFQPAQGVQRFLVGTPPVLSLLAVEVGLEPLLEAGVAGVRAKSEALTAFLIERFDARLAPLGLRLGTPRDPARRGSHVSVLHPDGYRVARALLGAGVVPDFREPDAIRLGLAPLYTRFLDVYEAVERLARVVEEGAYLRYDGTRAAVT